MKRLRAAFSTLSVSSLVWVLGVITVLITMRSLLASTFFRPHDFTHAARLVEMQRSLYAGEFPVRWSANFGFGYGMPLFNFYAPLPYYVGQIPLLIGFSAVDAIKFLYLVNSVLAFVGMYLFARELWGRHGGMLAAVVFSFSSYRAVDLFVRGALGEAFALVLLPFALYGILLIHKKIPHGWLVTALGISAILLSHNLTGMISVGIVVVWWFLNSIGTRTKLASAPVLVTSLLLAIGIAAFYVFPAFLEKGFTRVDQTITVGYFDYHNHFLCSKQLFSGVWKYGGSVLGCQDDISFSFGMVGWALFTVSIVFVLSRGKKQERVQCIGLLILFGMSVFMTIGRSQFIWDQVALLSYFQFPWRFLTFAHVFFAVIIGGLGLRLTTRKSLWITLLLCVVVGMTYGRFYMPERIMDKDQLNEYYNATPEWIRSETSKTLNDYLPSRIEGEQYPNAQIHRLQSQTAQIVLTQNTSAYMEATVTCEQECVVTANIFEFPGWSARVDGSKVDLKRSQSGLPTYAFSVPQGEHVVRVYLDNTPVRWVGNMISLLSVGGLLVAGYSLTRRKPIVHHV